MKEQKRTAFVLSGGGSLGAAQVGAMRALHERGWRPDLVVGASAGALNAAFLGAAGFDDGSLDELEAIWTSLRRTDVFPFELPRHVLALAGARPSLCGDHGLRRLVRRHLPVERLEDMALPVHIVATDLLSGLEVLLSDGPALDAVLASAAIPGVLPPVALGGRWLIDGGVANNTPISHALALGAERVVVIPAGVSCALTTPPTGALATALHALTILIQQRHVSDVALYESRTDLLVIPPLCPLEISSADFSHGEELIRRAHDHAGRWVDDGMVRLPHPERFLTLHDHGPAPVPHHPEFAA